MTHFWKQKAYHKILLISPGQFRKGFWRGLDPGGWGVTSRGDYYNRDKKRHSEMR